MTYKYEYALRLLKELNCPMEIMEALEVWGMLVRADEIKLHNWEALSNGGIIEGEATELGENEVSEKIGHLTVRDEALR